MRIYVLELEFNPLCCWKQACGPHVVLLFLNFFKRFLLDQSRYLPDRCSSNFRICRTLMMLSGSSLRQTAHTHCASVHQAVKLVPTVLRVAGVTAGLAESNGSLLPGLWLTLPARWLHRTGISSGTLRSVIEYMGYFFRTLYLLFTNKL